MATPEPQQKTLRAKLAGGAIMLLTAGLYYLMIQHDDRLMYGDMVNWMIVISERGFPAMAGEYAGYPPTYLYLLGLVSPLRIILSPVVLIKAVAVSFNLIGTLFVGLIIKEMTRVDTTQFLASILFLLLPTVAVESALWAQADIIYVVFLLAFFLCTLKGQSLNAMICFGVAFSFKLQSIFISPYILYLLLCRNIRWRDLAAVPLTYIVLMFPAHYAGRPWLELFGIYVFQANIPYGLSAQAPNFYMFVQKFALVSHALGTRIGMALAVVGGLAIAIAGKLRLPTTKENKLLVAVASLLLIPFLLPQMHERYFFAADVFSYVMAFVIAGAWPVAAMMQCASLLAYSVYLIHFGRGPYIGALFSLSAIVFVYRMLINRMKTSDKVHT